MATVLQLAADPLMKIDWIPWLWYSCTATFRTHWPKSSDGQVC